ncbi:anthranilate synthase component I family protein [Bordetella holmesii]|uniref:Anthranilate synthase component 1 n=1 Tax=Bordetella holmesii 1058 TaxID=1247648 RepID=A0ABN0S3N1_9BORD|nr:anthranilate synthase component I family protein [Bordetella holmesii]AHV94663.1 chorismate binding enzyme family protein [Bordetella holmesii ATCC 51541]AIT26390.1 chorismate binding enzyme family protein [Bordetella holmesii 44057]EWM43066.1 chorismate binding enzyme family protein [Bordetella holmesii 41130]EWM46963.1 chorismate binding enzyme family protein [Bordetella holmesii 35009]EWM51137.1 chorismate binding enzyme family protein [Bordetella holmesii 70147]
MTELEFKALAAQGYNRIPLVAETYADLDTPLAIYLKLAHAGPQNGRMSCLMESVVGGERFGRYSFIGLPAHTVIRASGRKTEVLRDGVVVETHDGDPLAFIEQYQARFKVALRPGMPRFCGGLAGYFGYDTVRHIEPRLGPAVKPFPNGMEEGTPDIMLLHVDELVIVDNLAGRTYLMVYADPAQPEAYNRAQERLLELRARLRKPVDIPYSHASMQTEERRDFAKQDYLAAVRRAKEYIAAGDLMQVQVGQVIAKPFRDAPLSLYRALRSLNPSPYMYFWNFGDFQVVGSSPEILVRQEQIREDGQLKSQITIRPLAGTRKRGGTPEEDMALAAELRADPKEIAEHVMLIDLARNDVGRVAEVGSVKVSDTMAIERYSHVMHLVSNVTGTLNPGMSSMDVLRAAFPAGTLTGAPKVRAMEIIDELEPVRRGIYGGAAGYLSYGGEMDVAIAIRTGVIKNGTLFVQAAAGVVADSVPELEWAETEAKARAVLRAAEQVQHGLDDPI